MFRHANAGRVMRRLLAAPAPPAAAAANAHGTRGLSTFVAPLLGGASRRAALTGARAAAGMRGGRTLTPSSLLPTCAAGLSSRPASTFLTAGAHTRPLLSST
jgi:hypothetical protein